MNDMMKNFNNLMSNMNGNKRGTTIQICTSSTTSK